MARLPSAADLGGPGSFRSGRIYASADTSAAGRGLSQLGAGLQNLGADLAAVEKEKRRQSVVADLPPVDSAAKTALLDFERAMETDQEFASHPQRFDAWVNSNAPQYAKGITDPRAREAWTNDFKGWAVGRRDSFLNQSTTRARNAQRVNTVEALDGYRNIFIDPKVDDATRTKAQDDIAATIDAAEKTGLLSPDQAYALRKANIEDANLTFAKLWVDQNPQAITPSMSSFDQRLIGSESGGRPGVINRLGYVGKYQFGAPRLATLGIYKTDENLGGWSKRAGTTGKWTGEFNIPGFPEVKTLQDFRASPEAQDAAYQIHKQKMDQEIEQFGLTGFIGQTVAGTVVTREGIYAMMHLGGAKGASDALKSGGTKNAKDENGTSLLDYLKMGAGGSNNPTRPPNYDQLDPVQRASIDGYVETKQREAAVYTRAAVEGAISDAPAAIAATGSYSGMMPTAEQFVQAYGANGPERYKAFQASVDTSREVHSMQTKSAEEIMGMVEDATPTGTGAGAALEAERYSVLTKAAGSVLKAREADPFGYVQRAFPAVGQAWAGVSGGSVPFATAVRQSVAAQQAIGIPADKVMPLPKQMVSDAVAAFGNTGLSEQERVSALTGAVFATDDPLQQQAIFAQMVKAGVPEYVTGALRAVERGDEGAARRLMQAALIDPDKLPGKVPETESNIRAQIQADLMDENGIGDAYYGLSDGAIENYAKAQADSTLLLRAVQMRMIGGEDLSTAVENAGKDLYGDMKIVTGDAGVNTKILVPADTDESETVAGLKALLPRVGQALEAQTAPAIAQAPAADGTKAIMEAAVRNRISDALSQGYFVSAPGGFAYLDVYTGMPISGPDGKPLVFTPEEVSTAAKAPPTRDPVNLDPEALFLEERTRALGGTTPSVGTIERTPPMPEPAPADEVEAEPAVEAPAVDVTPDAEARFMEERANALGGTTPRVGTGRPGGPITGGRF